MFNSSLNVRHAVRLEDQYGGLREAEDPADPELLAADPSYEEQQCDRGDGVPDEEHGQHRRGCGRGLGGEVARTPDDGDQQEQEIGTAGGGHDSNGDCWRR